MDNLLTDSQQKFQKVVDVVKQDLATIRTGKAAPQLIEQVVIEAYGTKMKLLELATITVSDATTLVVTPFDSTNVGAVLKGITEANLGLSAVQDDTKIRVLVPALSQERRQEYVKLARSKAEGGKVMARQVRHEAMEALQKEKLDEDTLDKAREQVQKWTDDTVEKLEILVGEKETELLRI